MSLSVVIPAYNEEHQIGAVIDEIRNIAGSVVSEIVVVDDGSKDRTAEIAERHGAKVVRRGRNGGYGAAIKAGSTNASSEYVITVDADGQHEPRDILALFGHRQSADLIVGARRVHGGSGLWRVPGKWLLRRLAEYLSGQVIPDLNSGMKLVRRAQFLRYAPFFPDGMSFSDTVTLLYLSHGLRVVFIPINVRARAGGKSTISFHTGLETFLSILNTIMLFNPIRIFLPVSLGFTLLGIGWAIPFLLMGHGLSVAALLLILTGVLTFFFGMTAEQISQIRKQMMPVQEWDGASHSVRETVESA